MAIPSYTTDLLIFNNITSNVGFGELSGYTGGSKEGIDPDVAIYGNVCMSASNRSATPCSLAYSSGTMPLGVDDAVFVWQKFFAPNSLATEANGGIIVGVGNSIGNYYRFTLDGSDTYAYGGWLNYAVSPTKLAGRTTVGSPNGVWSTVGVGWNMINGISKGNAFTLDIIRYGRGASIFTGGEVGNYAVFEGYATVNDNPNTGRFGLIQKISGGFLYKGLMSLGTASNLVDFRDSNKNITIDNTKHVSTAFNKIEVRNVSSNVEWTAISILSIGTVSRGIFDVIDNATVTKNSCTFTDMSTFSYLSNSTITSCTFRRCDAVTQGGASITSCVFDSPSGSEALISDNLSLITGNIFNSSGTGYAVNLGVVTDSTSIVWDNTESGYTGVAGTVYTTGTGNETIFIEYNGVDVKDISVQAGASTPTVHNTGTGTVTVTAGQVTTKIIVKSPTGDTISDSSVNVFIEADVGGGLPVGTDIIKGFTDINGEISDIRSFTQNQPITGWARKGSNAPYYKQSNITGTINSGTGLEITIQMVSDE